MKTLLLGFILSFLAQAHSSFGPVLSYYDTHIGEDDEAFIEVRTFKGSKSEPNYILGSILQKDYYIGFHSIRMKHLLEDTDEEDEMADMILNRLFDNQDLFFCDTLKDPEASCKQIVRGLVERLLIFTHDITLIDIEGSNYGDWRTIILEAIDWDSSRAITLEFDILHEI